MVGRMHTCTVVLRSPVASTGVAVAETSPRLGHRAPGEPAEWSKSCGIVERREREVRRIDHVVLGFASLAELTAFQGGLGGPYFAPLIELRGSA